jgi:hypothetical protein
VSYRVEFRSTAAQQTIGLSDDAYLALIQALGPGERRAHQMVPALAP